MSKEKIINYVMNTPGNTNPAVLNSLLDSENGPVNDFINHIKEVHGVGYIDEAEDSMHIELEGWQIKTIPGPWNYLNGEDGISLDTAETYTVEFEGDSAECSYGTGVTSSSNGWGNLHLIDSANPDTGEDFAIDQWQIYSKKAYSVENKQLIIKNSSGEITWSEPMSLMYVKYGGGTLVDYDKLEIGSTVTVTCDGKTYECEVKDGAGIEFASTGRYIGNLSLLYTYYKFYPNTNENFLLLLNEDDGTDAEYFIALNDLPDADSSVSFDIVYTSLDVNKIDEKFLPVDVVTSITAQSTDNEIPTAAAVWNLLGDIDALVGSGVI